MGKGAYTNKQRKSYNKGERNHAAGNPPKLVEVNGFGEAMKKFFEDRGQGQPSAIKILQTRGVETGVKKWVRRKQ